MSEMRLRQLAVPVLLGKAGFTFSAWGPLQRKKYKRLKKHGIQYIFIKINYIKPKQINYYKI